MAETATVPVLFGSFKLGKGWHFVTPEGGGKVAETITVPIPVGSLSLGGGKHFVSP